MVKDSKDLHYGGYGIDRVRNFIWKTSVTSYQLPATILTVVVAGTD